VEVVPDVRPGEVDGHPVGRVSGCGGEVAGVGFRDL
jgi:hypothetical protein